MSATLTKVQAGVRDEVTRLLTIVQPGLSAAAMAQISRMSLPDVEMVLAEMERAGDVATTQILLRGRVTEMWRRL